MMIKDATLERLRTQKRQSPSPRDEERREAWRAAVANLIARIREWTADAEKDGLLAVKVEPITLREAQIGEYEIDRLTLTTPIGHEIALVPVATYVLGADGRADLQGPRCDRKLVWRRQDDEWQTVQHLDARHSALGPLNEMTFWGAVDQMLPPDEGSDEG